MSDRVKVLLFAKAPEVGKVKTRLAPALSFEQAAKLYQLLLDKVVANLSSAEFAIEIWCVGDMNHPCWERYLLNPLISLHQQKGDDLGWRMQYAAKQALTSCDKVILVGADCIDIDKNYLALALKRLKNNDAVIGPATDGGYVLLALKSVKDEIFAGVEWGSEKVLAQTLAQMDSVGYRYNLLPALNDIDRPEDLANLRGIGDW